jgi:hypothetical protein
MALTLPKLTLPKFGRPKSGPPKSGASTPDPSTPDTSTPDTSKPTPPKVKPKKKQAPAILGGVIVVAALAWFGWQHFVENATPPRPARRPHIVAKAKPHAPVKPAPLSAEARAKLIAEVLSVTGLKQELDQLPERMMTGVRQYDKQQLKTPPALAEGIEDAVAKSFTADGFNSRVNAALTKNFDQGRLQALVREFSAPAAKNMVAQENAPRSPEDYAAFERSAAAKPPVPAREALIKRIDAASRASDTAVDVAFASMQALAVGIVSEEQGKTGSVAQAIEQKRAASDSKIRAATLLNLGFSFKDASDADLQKYARICENANTKWFYSLVHDALVEEATADSTNAGNLISQLKIKPAKPAKKIAARHYGPKHGADARACLALSTNEAIIKCAEAYR